MPAPHDVSTLRSFLGSVQFYAKFLPPTFASVVEPLYRLTRKGHRWAWVSEEEAAFRRLRELLSTADVLGHFDPSLPSGVACDASAVGIDATLFHRHSDGSERPIANVSKTLTASQRSYSQIQKEALVIIYVSKKFQLVTDHQPLGAMFGSNKPTPVLPANRWNTPMLMSSVDCLSVIIPISTRKKIPTTWTTFASSKHWVCKWNQPTRVRCGKSFLDQTLTTKVMRFTRGGWPEKNLQEDFAHFGFPHTVVTDCAATFKSEEFCKENGVFRLTGAPYHPATNGAANFQKANWVPAIVVKRFGTRSVNVRVVPRGSVWRRHIDQLRPRYFRQMTQNLVILPGCPKVEKRNLPFQSSSRATLRQQPPTSQNVSPEYGPSHPRRSKRPRKRKPRKTFLLLNLRFLRVVFSRTFLGASLPRSPLR